MDPWKRKFSFLEWMLLAIDLTGLPEIYQILHELFNWGMTSLPKHIEDEARKIFDDSINWQTIRVNGNNKLICKRMHIAFVSFHTIHYYDGISMDLLIHELVHVWQYERFGSAYIVRALLAQRSKMGYDYGGPLALGADRELLDFNFEQMAEIIRDGYLRQSQLPLYKRYIEQLCKL